MPSTPTNLKLSFQRNSYSRVSFGRNLQNDGGRPNSGPDVEPLQGNNHVEQFGIEPGVDYINHGTDEQMEVFGYCKHKIRTFITWFFIIFTLGALRLVFHWWPQWMLYATHRSCPLDIAQKVLVVERYQKKHKCYYVKDVRTVTAESLRNEGKSEEVVGVDGCWDQQAISELRRMAAPRLSVHVSGGFFKEMEDVRMFWCKKMCYVWDPDRGEFCQLPGLDFNVTTDILHRQKGLTIAEQFLRRAVYGKNEIEVPMRGVITLLFLEVLNPFYVFQIFSFILWFIDDYVQYAMAILAMTTFSIVMAIVQTRKNQHKLHSTVHSTDVVSVVRDGDKKIDVIPTELLVPGDLLILPAHGCIMHCDAVLLTGNCIVNESMLTGESVPVTKTPLPNSDSLLYNEKEHARHTLFCGTQVIQTRYYGNENVYAVVVRTGFYTTKGSLVRSILYPPPVDFKFEQDSYKFVQLLAAIASIGFVYTVITKTLRGVNKSEIALEALDLITIVVPPALPAAMTVGRMYAQMRLEKKDIYCISPRTINVSGSINCVCFDKTGTLTEDGLDMWGVVPVEDTKFQIPVKQLDKLPFSHLLTAMVTCHSLTLIDGKLNGDPLDLKMFECTGWLLEEPNISENNKFDLISPTVVKPAKHSLKHSCSELDLEVGIVRQFPFSSSLQRMSVISRTLGASEFTVYCKGSPEMIQTLCQPETIPHDFCKRLEGYTQEGYRVLGIAYRNLPSRLTYPKIQRLSREEVEVDLCFLGLVVLENRLKPQTTGVISVLKGANIRTVMVTGDNMLTALSVARDCGIVSLGQRVITVHAKENQNGLFPSIYYTQTNPVQPTIPDSTPTTPITEDKYRLSRDSNSMLSFGTVDSTTATTVVTANGTTRNSIITDIETPVDNNVCSPNDFGSATNYTFALTGPTWSLIRNHYPDLVPKIATRGTVFSRMSPDQKQQLVLELQALGYYVAMCGDGANDCGALKAAHTGISLSDAESSVASPFTSRDPNIECLVQVVREGRAALVTSFGIFKYMAAYSLTQFISVMILYSIDSNLSDIQYLFIDLFLITTFAFVLGRTEAYDGPLVSQPPQTSLMSLAPVVSLVGQMAIAVIFQLISFYSVQHYDWFVPYNSSSTESPGCYENYAVFTVSSLQYIILAVVFSKGPPYRKRLISNWSLLISVFVSCAFTSYLIIGPFVWLAEKFELTIPKAYDFKIVVFALGFGNFVLATLLEFFICDYLLFQKLRERRRKLGIVGTKKYLQVEKELNDSYNWPPLSLMPPTAPLPELPTRLHPPRSPLTITLVSSQQNGSAFSFPTKALISASDPRLETTHSTTDVIDGKNEVSTLPRRVPLAEKKNFHNYSMNRKCHPSQVSVDQSEDSLATYLTPPESLHSSEQEVKIDSQPS
ncbi:polyamine-transporting ATPase anne boleyn isoform X2 [Lycorma delicatula]|uniref:polyamine-transporting ATPase anne boleyn isoform X2 n=1 Tax=Lycorma delicatula TaxID=130591 RepID=UPI003F5170F4